MFENDIQEFYINILEQKGIPYIHIPNRVFGKYRTPKYLKSFPDLLFYYADKLYLRELGIPGRNKETKKEQYKQMKKWAAQGASILIVLSIDGAKKDLEGMGILIV